MSASANGVHVIENIQNYTQQYIDGALVLTPIETAKESETVINEIILYNEGLTKLPDLPKKVKLLFCPYNNLTNLPEILPECLEELYCFHNKLTKLPEQLPQTLIKLSCGDNKLTKLPDKLPDSLLYLYCFGNELTELPTQLPPNLKDLVCCNNKITILPDLPATLSHLNVETPSLEKNYPDIGTFKMTPDVINYINQRNREMRENPDPTLVDETYFDNNSSLSITCIVKKNGQIISNLNRSDISYKNIMLDLYRSFGINTNLINIDIYTNTRQLARDIINMIKSNDNMSIDLVVSDCNTSKKYRYIYGM